jgi:hypothetical protein
MKTDSVLRRVEWRMFVAFFLAHSVNKKEKNAQWLVEKLSVLNQESL